MWGGAYPSERTGTATFPPSSRFAWEALFASVSPRGRSSPSGVAANTR